MAEPAVTSREHNGEYGYDGSFHTFSAVAQMTGIGVVSAALFAGGGVALARANRLAAAIAAASALEVLATAASYIYATRAGKFVVWDRVLDDLRLHGDVMTATKQLAAFDIKHMIIKDKLHGLRPGRCPLSRNNQARLTDKSSVGQSLWRAFSASSTDHDCDPKPFSCRSRS